MIRRFVRARFWQWMSRRTPLAEDIRLTHRNIYIVPTREGGLFVGLLIVMLLTAINYQNSLIYLLVFLLGTLFVASIMMTFRNLEGVQIAVAQTDEAPLGKPLRFQFRLVAQDERPRASLQLTALSGTTASADWLAPQAETSLLVKGDRRGPLRVGWVCIETRYPFGLMRAWSWFRPQQSGVVWPRPLVGPEAMGGAAEESGSGADQQRAKGQDDLDDVRVYRTGDPMSRVLWKRQAEGRDWLVRTLDAPSVDPDWLDLEQMPNGDLELRLSWLAHAVTLRHRSGRPWGLRLGGEALGPDMGEAFYRRCQRALGMYGSREALDVE